jgi:D-alanyl-D-alanine carboxypeptidase (penicillin-binding protein 5/6)
MTNQEGNITRWFTFFHVLLFTLAAAASFCPSISRAAEISAKAAIVVDTVKETMLYGKNPDLKLPPASTTKLMTAMVALDTLRPDELVMISRKAARTSSIRPYLPIGERFRVRELLSLALIRSINGAAVALAESSAGTEKSFVALMNEKALSIGAFNTKFINASGLPGRGQYTTARDLARIMKEALSYPLIADIIHTPETALDVKGKTVVLTNTNNLLWTDNGHLGGKTGYTRAARHCFVGASDKEEGTLIIALLGDSSRDMLWTDAERLLAGDFEMGQVIIDRKESRYKNIQRQKAIHRGTAKNPGNKTKSL